MNINENNNVLIVGAGPVGITTACVLKALNPKVNITIIDKRTDPVRNHGLKIKTDSVHRIDSILKNALKHSEVHDPVACKALTQIFSNWKEQFIRTNEIEKTLAEKAKDLGITVIRDSNYEITEDNLDFIFNSDTKTKLSKNEKKLRKIFQTAQVIIGADGSHSLIRKKVMDDKKVEEKTLQYLIELKFQIDGNSQPRGYSNASFHSSSYGHMTFETMNRKTTPDYKPTTYHMFVDKATFDSVREVDDQGHLKGVFGNSWTMNELREKAKNDPLAKKVYRDIQAYLDEVEENEGEYCSEQISTLEMKIYLCQESVKKFKDKFVLLVGDANSGMVLERGFNKGLMEAGLCAEAVGNLFSKQFTTEGEVPSDLIDYQNEVRKIFKNEKWWAEYKSSGLTAARMTVAFVSDWIFSPFFSKQ